MSSASAAATAATAATAASGPAPTGLVEMRTPTLTLAAARSIAAAAEAVASNNHTHVVVTVIDAGAQVLLVERMPGAQLASLALAAKKARSAVYYQRPSAAFEQALAGGKRAVLALPDAMPAAGGIPMIVDHQMIGAIGVSGGSNAQDEQAAQAGIDALSRYTE